MAGTTGTTGDDHLNGGSGNDTLFGLAGDDRLNGGSGGDTVDGGAGSDTVSGDSGNDVLVYRASENVGSADIYDGGSGIDTLRLLLTSAEWMRPQVKQDVANYLLFMAGHTLPNGQADNGEFLFTAFDLRVSKVETLAIFVDGVQIDLRDQAVTAVNDTIATDEDHSSLGINLLANDSVPDLVQSVVIVSGPTKGSISLTTDFSNVANPLASVIYTPGAALQSLAVGESTTDTFTYRVTDADGDTSLATVTVTITGTNDAPLVTAEAGDSAGATLAETDSGLAATGTLTASDVDTSDLVTVSVTGVTHSGPTGGLSDAQLLGYFSVTAGAIDTPTTMSGQFTWDFNSGGQAFDFLAVGETLTLHYTIRPDDGHSPPAIGDGVVTIHITGTNDAPKLQQLVPTGQSLDETSLTLSGLMGFSDVDLTDLHMVSFEALGDGYIGTFTPSMSADSTGIGQGAVALTYGLTLNQFLAADGHIPDHQDYRITIDDHHGGTSSQVVSIPLAEILSDLGGGDGGGRENHAPVIDINIAAGDTPRGFISDGMWNPAPGLLVHANGTLSFHDEDVQDTHYAFAVGEPDHWGQLFANVTQDSTGSGTGGVIGWHYQVNDEPLLRALGQGQAHDDYFSVMLNDNNGATANQQVWVHLEGANDRPTLDGPSLNSFTLDTNSHGLLTIAGSFGYHDFDTPDSHSVSVNLQSNGSPLGHFDAVLEPGIFGLGSGGLVHWSYLVDPSTWPAGIANDLESFEIIVQDEWGATVSNVVQVHYDLLM